MQFKSSLQFKINAKSDDGNPVYFRIDTMELFGVDLHYPGLKECFNYAYRSTKNATHIPYDSGLTCKSYSIVELDDHTILLYFDANKIIGKMRKGRNDKKAREVKTYYVQYIASNTIRATWLDDLIHNFLKFLKSKVETLAKETPKDWRSLPGMSVTPMINLQSFTEYVEAEEMRYQIRKKRQSKELMTREEMKREIIRQKDAERRRLLELKKLKEAVASDIHD